MMPNDEQTVGERFLKTGRRMQEIGRRMQEIIADVDARPDPPRRTG
jgi:hypothetical protein